MKPKILSCFSHTSLLILIMLALGTGCSSSSDNATDAAGAANGGDGGSDNGDSNDGGSSAGGANDGGAVEGTNPLEDGGAPLAKDAVNLGTARHFAILAKSGVSTVPPSAITGDVGVSPAAATYLTGFSQTADASKRFATSTQVTGKLYAATYAAPTPSELTTAVGNMEVAFVDAAGRAAGMTELGAGNLGGKTLTPGVYKWGTGVLIPTDITLSGSATDVWIFQIAKSLTISSGASVLLAGGASAKNVFWQVSGLVDVGTTAHCEGTILSKTSITLGTGASVNGRLLAQTAVEIRSSTVVKPAD